MSSTRVVEALDEVEDGHPGLGSGPEPATVQQLALERGEEALAEGVVVGVSHRSHRRLYAYLPAAEAEGDGRVLGPLVRVVDHVLGPALPEGHLERSEHQIGLQCVAIDQPTTRRLQASITTAR